jgi:hypothetical protein
MRPRAKRLIWIAPLAILGMAIFITLGGTVVRLLWNGLLPELFGFPAVTFWQALGLLALCRILFGGFGMHGGGRRSRRAELWARMTPEERERFHQRMRGGFDVEPPAGDAPTP